MSKSWIVLHVHSLQRTYSFLFKSYSGSPQGLINLLNALKKAQVVWSSTTCNSRCKVLTALQVNRQIYIFFKNFDFLVCRAIEVPHTVINSCKNWNNFDCWMVVQMVWVQNERVAPLFFCTYTFGDYLFLTNCGPWGIQYDCLIWVNISHFLYFSMHGLDKSFVQSLGMRIINFVSQGR